MLRGKSSSSLQKTYDECYLTCSTAVYFESQGNEAEALRSWRSALDNIYYHNAKTPANFVPKSETEKALRDSLRDMEIQCKERVDLLEALRLSRAEAAADKDGSSGSGNASSSTASGMSKLLKPSPRESSESQVESTKSVPGSVGEGTIPAIHYSDLSRPDLRSSSSSFNSRPFAPSRNSSERAVVGRHPSSSSMSTSNHMDAALKAARNPGIGLDSLSQLPPLPPLPPRTVSSTTASSSRKKSSRSPSPHKERTMLTTLRFGRGEKRPAKPAQRNSGGQETVGGKAATLAWNALKKRDEGTRSTPLEIAASSAALDASRKTSLPLSERNSPENRTSYDSQTRKMVSGLAGQKTRSSSDAPREAAKQRPSSYPFPGQEDLRRASGVENAAANANANAFPGSSLLSGSAVDERYGETNANDGGPGRFTPNSDPETGANKLRRKPVAPPPAPGHFEPTSYPTYLREYPDTVSRKVAVERQSVLPLRNNSPAKPERRERERVSYSRHAMNSSSPRKNSFDERDAAGRRAARGAAHALRDNNGDDEQSSTSYDERAAPVRRVKRRVPRPQKQDEDPILAGLDEPPKSESDHEADTEKSEWDKKVKYMLKHLPRGCDEQAAKQIFNDIVVKGDEVHWSDVAGLEHAKNALKEAVVYPFLRPDLFMGLREPARGMLLFGPPGTGKTMLARAVATESKSTFFGVSASSLTSKYLGESEKLVKALFLIAREMAPSIIFVDEIDSLLGSRGGGGEHEATRRIKTEFLIQWSDLQRAAAGREQTDKDKQLGDATRVLVLAATNMPWAIDDAARRRFVRRQYIPLPERETRATQLKTLLGHQNHSLTDEEFEKLVDMTDGFSGSDITALAKDAAMGPLRSLGEALLHMTMDEIRPIGLEDFEKSMENIRPSVSRDGLKEYEDWAREFGERGG